MIYGACLALSPNTAILSKIKMTFKNTRRKLAPIFSFLSTIHDYKIIIIVVMSILKKKKKKGKITNYANEKKEKKKKKKSFFLSLCPQKIVLITTRV